MDSLQMNLLREAEGGHISDPPSCNEQTTKEQQLVSNRAKGSRVNEHCNHKLKFNILSFSKQNIEVL